MPVFTDLQPLVKYWILWRYQSQGQCWCVIDVIRIGEEAKELQKKVLATGPVAMSKSDKVVVIARLPGEALKKARELFQPNDDDAVMGKYDFRNKINGIMDGKGI